MSNRIIKGFTDKAGNRVQVEGAGTDYNEGKNSVAIGNGTTAVGDDQFVFGRRNAPAANKAEVVGGGNLYELGDVIVPANPSRNEEAMIYAGHSLTEFRTFLQQNYGITPEDVVIADEHRTISGTNMQGQRVYIDVPNVADYDNLAFVVSEVLPGGDDDDDIYSIYCLYIYGIDVTAGIIFQPFSELQGHFYFKIEDGVKRFTDQGLGYFTEGCATLRGAVGNPGLGEHWFNHNGNFYKTIMALREKNIRTLDWEGNESIDGDLTVGGDIDAGGDVTCDDGEGNKISLRALAAAVAELQEAQGGDDEQES